MSKITEKKLQYISIVIFFIIGCIALGMMYSFDVTYENATENDEVMPEILSSLEPKEQVENIEEFPDTIRNKIEVKNDLSHESIFDTVRPTNEQSDQLYKAEQALVKQCMNERGFEYITGIADIDLEHPEDIKDGDIAMANTRGYGIVENIEFQEKIGIDTLESVNGNSEPIQGIHSEA